VQLERDGIFLEFVLRKCATRVSEGSIEKDGEENRGKASCRSCVTTIIRGLLVLPTIHHAAAQSKEIFVSADLPDHRRSL
jgi:hypothetical protein